MARSLTAALVVLVRLPLTAHSAAAQVRAGSILVRAVDEHAAVIPGVTVTIKSPVIILGQISNVTDSRGTYRFAPLLPGIYSVTFELTGFQTIARENVVVSVGQTTSVDHGFPNSVNPNFATSAEYVWNDLNGDWKVQPSELGALLSRSGSLVTSMNPNLKQPFSDELSGGIDHELIPDLRLSDSFAYRRERKLYDSEDVGMPASANGPAGVTDIGPDGLTNTGDEVTLFLWNQDAATLGRNRFVITNSDALNRAEEFSCKYRG